MTKYIFISGGVSSSLGKGLTAASIALLLEKKGYKIAMMKLDPYLNVDPGTMSPFQHGEVYVTDDGAETDLDLGHYYRFCNTPLSKASNATSGQIYDTVIKRERKGDYLGKCVQVIPHVTNEIKTRISACAEQEPDIDIVFVEVGGTVGDIESLPFFEAIRQFRNERHNSSIFIHLTYTPYLKAAGEIKTKPTQHSVQELRSIGILPNVIICRSEVPLDDEIKEKISLFCDVSSEAVFEALDAKRSIYEIPLLLKKQNIDGLICKRLGLKDKKVSLSDWKKMVDRICAPKHKLKIALVGKYVQHQDAYKSVTEGLFHAGIANQCEIDILPIEADKLTGTKEDLKLLKSCDGCLIPGGFGQRGWEGKISVAKYCRENKVPYFGICLGMQVLVVEFARHVAGIENANSTEIEPKSQNPVISLLSEQKGVQNLGGTMRLGAYPCKLIPQTKAHKAYQKINLSERHRHRYEVNNAYRETLEKFGLVFSGEHPKAKLCEIAEVKNHPWMVAAQFHPEFKSRPNDSHPLFKDFIAACLSHHKKRSKK